VLFLSGLLVLGLSRFFLFGSGGLGGVLVFLGCFFVWCLVSFGVSIVGLLLLVGVRWWGFGTFFAVLSWVGLCFFWVCWSRKSFPRALGTSMSVHLMKVAILGAGGGGLAVAHDFSQHGHEVRVFDFEMFPENVEAVKRNKGVYAEGDLEGFAEVEYAGHDVGEALDGAELVIAVGPAYSTRPFADACKPYLRDDQVVIVCPSSCGGCVEFKNGVGRALDYDGLIVAETNTLPYAVRVTEPGRIRVFLKLRGGLFLAALPAGFTSRVLGMVGDVYPYLVAAKNVLQTSLQNGNPVIHPAITLLNVGLIERSGGDFFFYEDGVTDAVGRLVEAVDLERLAIAERLGVDVLPDPELGMLQGYQTENNYDSSYREAPGYRGIKAQSRLDYRYFNEDVGYGLVFMSDLGAQIGVPTPHMDSIITIVSTLMMRDYRGERKRTMGTLGLDGYSLDELIKLIS